MKKKLISSFLTFAMLLQAFAFMPAIAAESESESIINFSFEEESAQTAKFESLLKNVSNGAYTAVDSSKINYLKNSAYGIGRYLKNTQTMWAIKLEEPIDRTDEKYINKALTVEYDFMPLKTPDSSLNPTSGGAGSVVLAALNTETGKYANFSGLEFNNTGNIYKFWARNPSLGSFEPNKWYRCKFVMILNENGSVKHENNFTYYINGEMLATGKDYTAGDIIECLRLYTGNGGNFGIDNLKISIDGIGAETAEKGALIKRIRDFENKYGDISGNAEAAALISGAKAVYENESAAAAEVNAALADIDKASDLVFPEIKTLLSYDFETEEGRAAFKKGLEENSSSGHTVSFVSGDETFGTGTSASNGYSHVNFKISPSVDRTAESSKNLYAELEFDMMPVSVSETGECLGAVTLVSGKQGSYKHCGGIQFYSKPNDANSGYFTAFWKPGKHIAKYELGKWYRLKMRVLLNDNGTLNNTGVIDYYINGENVLTENIYSSGFEVIENLRLYASNAKFKVDNLSLKTFKAANPPAEKGRLTAELRSFVSEFRGYEQSPGAKELFDSAAAVYANENATQEEIETARENLSKAKSLVLSYTAIINEDFESSPSYFFDKITSGGETKTYTASSAKPEEISYAADEAYMTGETIEFAPNGSGIAEKVFETAALGDEKYLSFSFDAKGGSAKISGTNGEALSFSLDGELKRYGIYINCKAKTYDLYINGEKALSGAALESSASDINALSFETSSKLTLDNVLITEYNSPENAPGEKGALVCALRAANSASGLGAEESSMLKTAAEKAAVICAAPLSAQTEIDGAAKKIAFMTANLSASKSGENVKEIIVPGTGKDLENVIIRFNLHYGNQEGNVSYKELFFGGKAEKDFSDVMFTDHEKTLESEITSNGNYDFISDDKLGQGASNLFLSDGRIVTQKSGYISISSDNGESWQNTAFKGRLYFADRDDNIYYAITTTENAGLYKLSAADGYAETKRVIDCTDAYEQIEEIAKKVSGTEKEIIWGNVIQDDDGYIYAGRYTTPWIGAVLYVSDSTGENFRAVDFRADKQHNHTIRINRNVYPNEVYVTYDDSTSQPLCQVTTDHAGYEEIKDDPDFMHPIAARSTGNASTGSSALADEQKQPANEAAKKLLANGKKHFRVLSVPFANNDFLGYFGVKDKSEDKFYTAENGKKYTTADNVYALGYGEANILGGPGLYKTTDINDPSKYYAVIENAQGSRILLSPEDGVLIWGGLAGRMCMTPQLCVSYDDGETWQAAYTEGYNYSAGAGNGPFRMISEAAVPQGSNEKQVLMAGWGTSPSMRAKFGGDNYFGYSSVLIDYLPAEGIKLFAETDKNLSKKITAYEYAILADGTAAIKSTKISEGGGSALKFPVERTADSRQVYMFDVSTENKTAVSAVLSGSNGITSGISLNLVFRTDSGAIYNGETDSYIGSAESLKSGHFSAKLDADLSLGKCTVYINGSPVGETELCGANIRPEEFMLFNSDLSAESSSEALKAESFDSPLESSPVIVYFSGVGYADAQKDKTQFIVKSISLKNGEEAAEELKAGTLMESIEIEKLDSMLSGAVLIVALYDANGVLKQSKTVSVSESGSYPIGLAAAEDNMQFKLIMVRDMEKLTPVYMRKAF